MAVFPFFFIILTFLLPPSSSAFQNEPDGFGGIIWGTDISMLAGMTYDSKYSWAAGTTTFYTRKGDLLTLGEAKPVCIRYGFFNGKLSDVLIETRGRNNWLALKKACFEKFGQGFKGNYYLEHYRWSGKISSIVLEYKEKEDLGTLLIKSEMMYSMIRSELRKKADEQHSKP